MKKNKKGGNVLIDLTSLLDVVFIVLLVVICQLYTDKQAMAETENNISNQEAQLQSQQELYEDQLNALGKTNEYLTFISVNAHFDPDLITRHIEIMNSDKNSIIPEIPELKGLSVSDAHDGLRNYIDNYVSENPDKMIVISLNENDEEILYRDEKAIKSILNELRSRHENVRLRGEEDI